MNTTPAERLGAGRYLTAGNRPESVITTVRYQTACRHPVARRSMVIGPSAVISK